MSKPSKKERSIRKRRKLERRNGSIGMEKKMKEKRKYQEKKRKHKMRKDFQKKEK